MVLCFLIVCLNKHSAGRNLGTEIDLQPSEAVLYATTRLDTQSVEK